MVFRQFWCELINSNNTTVYMVFRQFSFIQAIVFYLR